MKKKQVELLAPACDKEGLIAAFHAGADAVYLGGEQFGARAYANNFSKEDLLWSIDYAHLHDKIICLTVNTLLKDREVNEQLYDYIRPFYEEGLDAVIVQDYGVFSFLKKNFPNLALHASTQMTITGVSGAMFLKEQGASRVVLARELSMREIEEIATATGLETEVFVHGALCYCYSGQCLLSSMLGGRSGNRGRCAQPCRLSYQMELPQENKKRSSGEYYPMSLKDLCSIEQIPQLIEAGAYSFKIEGRMKRPEYAAGVTEIYRKYIDRYFREEFKAGDPMDPSDRQKLLDLGNRGGFTEGYFYQHNSRKMLTLSKPNFSAESSGKIYDEMKTLHGQKLLYEPIGGVFRAKTGEKLSLTVRCREHEVTAEGIVAQMAEKTAVTEEKVKRPLLQTGTSPFYFKDLKIELDPGCFFPMQAVKELRRRALAELEEQILISWKRKGMSPAKETETHTSFGVFDGKKSREERKQKEFSDCSLRIHAAVETEEQLEAALLSSGIARIYIDSHIKTDLSEIAARMKETKTEWYLALPKIQRMDSEKNCQALVKQWLDAGVDGILIENINQYGSFINQMEPSKMVLSPSMYQFNTESLRFFRSQGIKEFFAPVELNEKELKKLHAPDMELQVYGYQPLMISAQCFKKTQNKCVKELSGKGWERQQTGKQIQDGPVTLRDRYNKEFRTKTFCRECYNVLYNSLPLSLLKQKDTIRKMNLRALCLSFTFESREETKKIIQCFKNAFLYDKEECEIGSYTNGHFKRGVE